MTEMLDPHEVYVVESDDFEIGEACKLGDGDECEACQ